MKFKSDKKARGEIFAALSLLTHIGLSMLICVVGGILLGVWLDSLTGLAPLFLLVFLFIGVGAAFRSLFTLTGRFHDIGKEPKKNAAKKNNEKRR
jgi:F0F1-type ATP synthase assembly protein I